MTKWLRGRNVISCLIVVYVQGIIHISCNNDTPIFLHLLRWLNAQIQYEQMLIKFWLWVHYINLLISEILWLIDFKTCKRNKCIPTKMFFSQHRHSSRHPTATFFMNDCGCGWCERISASTISISQWWEGTACIAR